ncbi:MAG: hypothetical protein R6X12_05655 [bacterium]
MRCLPVLALLGLAALGQPAGWVTVGVDSLPMEVYFDGTAQLLAVEGAAVELSPGRHYVSLFGPRKVFQAFKDDAPEEFWDGLRAQRLIGEGNTTQLLSSYERGAVRVGTKWIYVVPDETLDVRLSSAEVSETYRRDSSGVLSTFVGWTLLIGLGMALSVFLIKLG